MLSLWLLIQSKGGIEMIVSNETTMINFLNLYLESDGKSLEELDYIAKGILYDLEANKPLEDLENYVMEESK